MDDGDGDSSALTELENFDVEQPGTRRSPRKPKLPAVRFLSSSTAVNGKRKTGLLSGNDHDDDDVSVDGETRRVKKLKRRIKAPYRDYKNPSLNLYVEPKKRALTLGQRETSSKSITWEEVKKAADQIVLPHVLELSANYNSAHDAANDNSSLRNAEWLAEQQKAGNAEYFALSQPARRKLVVEYYCKCAGASNPRLETMKYFHKQRGWPKATVYKLIRAYVQRGQTESKKPPGSKCKYDIEGIQAKYREKLAAVGGDVSKMSMRQFCRENGLNSSTGRVLVLKDKHLDEKSSKRTRENEVHFEAMRSLIIAKFIEFTGDYHERRNACVRYFWKTPGFTQMNVRAAVNKFVRSGSIRAHDKNSRTKWSSEDMRTRANVMDLKPEEEEFMQVLNDMQVEIGHSNSVQGDARVQRAKNNSGDALALTDSSCAVQLRAALAELQSTREALVAAQRRIELLQSSSSATNGTFQS